MKVECRFFGPFRDDVGQKTYVHHTDAETYETLLREIEAEFPVLGGRLVDDGSIAGQAAITRNGRNVRHFEGLGTNVEDGDVVRMTPSVYGGCRV